MNYFEIINAILLELNYEQISSFDALTKVEHKRIMDVVNRLNKEICTKSDDFNFRQMHTTMNIYPNKIEYEIPFSGKTLKIIGQNKKYEYDGDFEKFYQKKADNDRYSIYGNKLLFPSCKDKVKIFYLSDEFVVDKSGNYKENFEKAEDKTVIPATLVEKIFVNGGAYKFKQNTSHPKYVHWKQEFEQAIAELLSTSKKSSSVDLKINGGFRKI